MKRVLVTGASGGIGSATVKKLIKDGYFVFGQYNSDKQGIDELVEELSSQNLSDYFFPVRCDFSKKGECEKLCQTITQSYKGLDALVLNAGKDLYKLATDTTEEEWDELFDINVKSNFLLTKTFLPQMIKNQKGKIVFVSSIWGEKGACMESVYSATKFAVNGYAKSLAKELGPSNITVNCVCPGVIDTKMNKDFTDSEMQRIIQSTPLGRVGKPEEVAFVISFLLSDGADFITGATLTIDGGFTL